MNLKCFCRFPEKCHTVFKKKKKCFFKEKKKFRKFKKYADINDVIKVLFVNNS